MTTNQKDPVLVVLQLSGGNDYMNTVIPYTDPLYRDNRPAVGVPEDQVLAIDGDVGFNLCCAGTVNDRTAPDNQIMGHRKFLL